MGDLIDSGQVHMKRTPAFNKTKTPASVTCKSCGETITDSECMKGTRIITKDWLSPSAMQRCINGPDSEPGMEVFVIDSYFHPACVTFELTKFEKEK